MDKGTVHIFFGQGIGKTTAAIGQGINAASHGRSVIIIQFLKEKNMEEIGFIGRLEPEIKLFRFEKSSICYDKLTIEEKKEEAKNLLNGFNFAKKVLLTEECDVLILDEVLGLLEHGIVSIGDMKALIAARKEEATLILTGINKNQELWNLADGVTEMVKSK